VRKDGHVGLGTNTPGARLEVAGSFKLTDGSQGDGKVLTSDANGLASWTNADSVGGSLDKAYDFGGPGAGKTIIADTGALHIAGTDGLMVTGTIGSGDTVNIAGTGVRLFFNPRKAAFRAGYALTDSWDNKNIGFNSIAMGKSTKASGNTSTAMGYKTNASGDYSTAMGYFSTASGNQSTAIGRDADATGNNSIALGYEPTASGENSIAIGTNVTAPSAYEMTIGYFNTYYSPISPKYRSSQDRLFVIGNGKNSSNKHDALIIYKSGNMVFNDSIGFYGDSIGIGTTTPGARLDVAGHIWQTNTGYSVFIGEEAGQNDDLSNNYNCFIGYQAGKLNTAGSGNTVLGHAALYYNTTGVENTAIGLKSLMKNTGSQNTAVGYGANLENTTGGYNTSLGDRSLRLNTTGNYNTACGANALYSNTTGNKNTALGYMAFRLGATDTNSTAIGYNAQVTGSNMIRLGDANVTSIGGQVAWTNFSDGRFKRNINENVSGLNFILKLRPVTYNWDLKSLNRYMGLPDSLQENYGQAERIIHSGFIAQEVEKAANESGFTFDGVHKPQNDHDPYALSYAQFVVPLVKAVQEQQKMIELQKKQIEAQKAENAQMQAQMKDLLERMQKLENKNN